MRLGRRQNYAAAVFSEAARHSPVFRYPAERDRIRSILRKAGSCLAAPVRHAPAGGRHGRAHFGSRSP
jgi:hypothetical protein